MRFTLFHPTRLDSPLGGLLILLLTVLLLLLWTSSAS